MRKLVLGLVMMAAPAMMMAQGVSGADTMKGEEPKPTGKMSNGQAAPPSVSGEQSSASGTWTNEELLPLSVHEAWVQSGRNEDKFFDMVKQLAELSASKRGVTLPETETAGQKAGEWIKKEARKDPDQLLYVVVDRAVQKVGQKAAMASK